MEYVDKLVRGVTVAVVVGKNRGDRLATNSDVPSSACLNGRLASAVLGESGEDVCLLLETLYPDCWSFGYPVLEVEWVAEGTEFYVREEESMERLVFKDEIGWLTT